MSNVRLSDTPVTRDSGQAQRESRARAAGSSRRPELGELHTLTGRRAGPGGYTVRCTTWLQFYRSAPTPLRPPRTALPPMLHMRPPLLVTFLTRHFSRCTLLGFGKGLELSQPPFAPP